MTGSQERHAAGRALYGVRTAAWPGWGIARIVRKSRQEMGQPGGGRTVGSREGKLMGGANLAELALEMPPVAPLRRSQATEH